MLLFKIIKPVFPSIISKLCVHLKGPNAVPESLEKVHRALNTEAFTFCIRADIRGYYASIDHTILLGMLMVCFQDPRLQRYFEAIVTAPIDRDAVLYSHKKGIPIRGSLSPFFGALYLTPLDKAFENRKGVFYLRFMDDILIFAKTYTQYQRAKKTLYKELRALKLTLSHSKTRMGRLKQGFHFLGANFNVQAPSTETTAPPPQPDNNTEPLKGNTAIVKDVNTQITTNTTCLSAAAPPATKIEPRQTGSLKTQFAMTLHPRCCRRALENVKMRSTGEGFRSATITAKPTLGLAVMVGSEPPSVFVPDSLASQQHYIFNWGNWWERALNKSMSQTEILLQWVSYAHEKDENKLARLGLGLLSYPSAQLWRSSVGLG